MKSLEVIRIALIIIAALAIFFLALYNASGLYSDGRPFPKALRELLFLAGEYCYVLSFGLNRTQTRLQESVREDLIDYELSIPRPFYAIDIYNAHDMCLFVYLDEVADDPVVHEAVFEGDSRGWLHSINLTLSGLVNLRLKKFLRGENPF
jgi:hypothetical protein